MVSFVLFFMLHFFVLGFLFFWCATFHLEALLQVAQRKEKGKQIIYYYF